MAPLWEGIICELYIIRRTIVMLVLVILCGFISSKEVFSAQYPRAESDSRRKGDDFNMIHSFPSVQPRMIRDVNLVGVSLVFVFDTTASMTSELEQVKEGATQIVKALRASDEIVIRNYVLVPFNDPEIGPYTVTTDPNRFLEQIKDITVYSRDNRDCAEMSMGGIKKALEMAMPKSFFYVFTDASAKDFHLKNDVLALVQQRQAQIVFIITEGCSSSDTKYYDEVATASSGQVYQLSKPQVAQVLTHDGYFQVLQYVKLSLHSDKVNLVSVNRPAPVGAPEELRLPVDKTVVEFTVSVSGKNAEVTIRDPQGLLGHVKPLLTLENVKILSVNEPSPGSWQLGVRSMSDYSLRATGRSSVHFEHGFSKMLTTNMKQTNKEPQCGSVADCYLLVQASDAETVYNLTNVDIVGINGTLLRQLPLKPVPSDPKTFFGARFSPPSQFFNLRISGYGKDGFPINRLTSTAIGVSHEQLRIAMEQYAMTQPPKNTDSTLSTTEKLTTELTTIKPSTASFTLSTSTTAKSTTTESTTVVSTTAASTLSTTEKLTTKLTTIKSSTAGFTLSTSMADKSTANKFTTVESTTACSTLRPSTNTSTTVLTLPRITIGLTKCDSNKVCLAIVGGICQDGICQCSGTLVPDLNGLSCLKMTAKPEERCKTDQQCRNIDGYCEDGHCRQVVFDAAPMRGVKPEKEDITNANQLASSTVSSLMPLVCGYLSCLLI